MSKKPLSSNIINLTAAAGLITGAVAGKPTKAAGKQPTVIDDTKKTGGEGEDTKPEPVAPKRPKLKFEKRNLKLDSLAFSHKFQAREALSKEAVSDYTELAKAALEKGADSPFPPLRAIERGGEILVYSGFTRGAALKKAGYESTAVEVATSEDITDAEIFRMAIEANQEHGVRLSNADKLHNLNKVLKFSEFAGLSNNALTDVVGASEFFIRTHRPVSSAPTSRKTKSGKTMKTGRIGKKGGKAEKAAKPGKKGKKGSDDEFSLNTGNDLKGTVSTGLDDETERKLNRICTVLNGFQGITSSGIRSAVEDGTLKLSHKDIREWADTSDSRIKLVAPLILSFGWTPKRAFAHIDKQVDANTKLDHLINSANAFGGVLRRSTVDVGEDITGNTPFKVLVWDSKRYEITIKEKK